MHAALCDKHRTQFWEAVGVHLTLAVWQLSHEERSFGAGSVKWLSCCCGRPMGAFRV